ncbi:DUF1190 domain-containing protein [Rhizobium sp. BK176]|uniref:DUF1190 domain-containing protein n=1 Tax=Rhizobium sp. BK176 TaxID=2587071 RepID=UPI002169A0F1|nr:DUF1190 domain-containing protein [Rhizobium sp. BK176]MCS4088657.1 uncharacterized protein YgiB involved in biofilm formation [Rhizobium sp. BK176]
MKSMTSSRTAAYLLLLASTSMLVACGEKPVDTALVDDPKSCPAVVDVVKPGLSGQDRTDAINKCESDYTAALADHDKNAPAFNSLADCEVTFDKCAPTTAAHSTGSNHFAPLMTGYLLGSMMSRNSTPYFPQAAYHPRTGSYVNSSGVELGKSFGKTRFDSGSSALKTPPVRTTTLTRNGFGVKPSTSGTSGSSSKWSMPKSSSSSRLFGGSSTRSLGGSRSFGSSRSFSS